MTPRHATHACLSSRSNNNNLKSLTGLIGHSRAGR